MFVTADDLSAFRFSTEDISPGERLAVYRDLFRDKLAKFDTKALGNEFSCNVYARGLPELMILRFASTPVRVTWTRELIKNRNQDDLIILALFRGGRGNVSQRGREADVENGSAILLSGTEPLTMLRTNYTYFSIPRASLAPLVGNVDRALMSSIPADSEALRLLSGYADLLTRDTEIMSPQLRRLADAHGLDLVALAIGATRDAAEIAQGRGLRAARLRAIKADIGKNLGSATVRAAALAARNGVTPRYIHKLFESEGTTLSRFVLHQRLVRVHHMLANPRCEDLTIGAIA
ncbi:AraC family transcriptional regulator [Bradyrhizobium sp. 157]|uniref:AraC-like ligand-binding domain-containing protein n=1 Tax=Bradyrhizobium sp. 157 TaxID=2782631 RepID=UPI001FF75C54|nr:AraC family transcriptional regulator [Bradyrhizobium sp. 157]